MEPESDFKAVFEVIMIVGGRMSHPFCSLEMEYPESVITLDLSQATEQLDHCFEFFVEAYFVWSISERSVVVKFRSRIGAGVSYINFGVEPECKN